MKLKKRLPVFAPEFPSMQCDEGCGDCCGPAPLTQTEFDRAAAYVREHSIVPKDQGVTCPVYLDSKCAIYDVRPLACRAFGHAEGLDCSRGYNTNIPSEVMSAKIRANGRAPYVTHDLLTLRNPLLSPVGVLRKAIREA